MKRARYKKHISVNKGIKQTTQYICNCWDNYERQRESLLCNSKGIQCIWTLEMLHFYQIVLMIFISILRKNLPILYTNEKISFFSDIHSITACKIYRKINKYIHASEVRQPIWQWWLETASPRYMYIICKHTANKNMVLVKYKILSNRSFETTANKW